MESAEPHVRVPAGAVIALAVSILEKVGLPTLDARDVADALTRADLRGVETHGMRKLVSYVDQLRNGRLNPRPNITVVHESPVSAVVDGDGGMGAVVGVRAMDLCISKALNHGLCAVAVRRSSHFGMASHYALRCLPFDLIGLSLSNNAGTAIVPTYGITGMLATNPISIVAPAGQEAPFELDFATSVVPMNKIGMMLNQGLKTIPLGWALD